MIDWVAIGGYLGMVGTGFAGYIKGRGKRAVESAATGAETDVIVMLRQEVARLSARLTAMEGREGRLIRHVYRLEGLMAGANLTPPPFELDGVPIKAGGTD